MLAQNLYEGMFLLDSSKFATDPDGVSQQVLGILEKVGAQVVAHRPWQDGKLAYEVEGHRKGLHYLIYFEMDGIHLTEVTRACQLSDVVIRHMVIRHPKTLFDAMVSALNAGSATSNTDDVSASSDEVTDSDSAESTKTETAEVS